MNSSLRHPLVKLPHQKTNLSAWCTSPPQQPAAPARQPPALRNKAPPLVSRREAEGH
ncbi:hypothetical protein E2C01_069568 [Portunus trituberculatus]|uniref:Uncharacterized protein n=1 Tax=Portunus trituberculatus TaxID=210409 RepID=A0A5B7I354_PORTR|nr:hypothetical protein [Portunus trituberculatus]